MFKVVTDQLKVSQGWVRCGQCTEVFDASLNLQSAPEPTYTPPQSEFVSSTHASAPYSAAKTMYAEQPLQSSGPDWAPGIFFVDSQGAPSSESRTAAVDSNHVADFDPDAWKQSKAVTPLNENRTLQLNEYGEAIRAHALDAQGQAFDSPGAQEDSEAILGEFPLESGPVSDDVSFVRDARRKAMWRKPAVRGALALFGLMLAATLCLQVLVQQRDNVAALEPALKPLLQSLCKPLQCDVGPLRRIEAVVIDSSSFNKTDSDSYRLNFSLKNTGNAAVAMPSLEVTLTDTQDQALVRRVLSPGQFGAIAMLLPAGGEALGSVAMQVASPDSPAGVTAAPAAPLRVAGYRVLAFYP
jgi:predicted Zn finger-like uncharacterized protein